MSDKQTKPQERSMPEKRDLAMSLVWSMADTTWRMFTPPLIVVPLGFVADMSLRTKPWLTLASVPVALVLSVLLVKKQLEQTK